MKKYEITDIAHPHNPKLRRIRALIAIAALAVVPGDLGGYVESEENLSQYGDAWVSGNARVSGNAWVCGDARVYGDAWVSGNAWVCGDARVSGNARVCGDARVYGDAWVSGDARVYGDAWVSGNAWVCGDARVSGDASILWISRIGSENGTLTVCTGKTGLIAVRGCFSGSLEEFATAVAEKHGGTQIAEEYALAIQLCRLRLSAAQAKIDSGEILPDKPENAEG